MERTTKAWILLLLDCVCSVLHVVTNIVAFAVGTVIFGVAAICVVLYDIYDYFK